MWTSTRARACAFFQVWLCVWVCVSVCTSVRPSVRLSNVRACIRAEVGARAREPVRVMENRKKRLPTKGMWRTWQYDGNPGFGIVRLCLRGRSEIEMIHTSRWYEERGRRYCRNWNDTYISLIWSEREEVLSKLKWYIHLADMRREGGGTVEIEMIHTSRWYDQRGRRYCRNWNDTYVSLIWGEREEVLSKLKWYIHLADMIREGGGTVEIEMMHTSRWYEERGRRYCRNWNDAYISLIWGEREEVLSKLKWCIHLADMRREGGGTVEIEMMHTSRWYEERGRRYCRNWNDAYISLIWGEREEVLSKLKWYIHLADMIREGGGTVEIEMIHTSRWYDQRGRRYCRNWNDTYISLIWSEREEVLSKLKWYIHLADMRREGGGTVEIEMIHTSRWYEERGRRYCRNWNDTYISLIWGEREEVLSKLKWYIHLADMIREGGGTVEIEMMHTSRWYEERGRRYCRNWNDAYISLIWSEREEVLSKLKWCIHLADMIREGGDTVAERGESATTLHDRSRHGTALHYATLRDTTHYTTPHYTTLRYAALHHATPHHNKPHHTTPHSSTPHYATHHITLHHTAPHYTAPHHTTPHYTTPYCTTLQHTTPHYTL